MATSLRPPTKNTWNRDTQGSARFAELRTIARLNAKASAIIYRVSGTVSRDVVPRLRQWVYGVQSGRVELGRDLVPMLDVLVGGIGRTVSHVEARNAAIELLTIARQLVDLKLPPITPADPEPDAGQRTVRRAGVSSHWIGRLVGSDDNHAPTGRAA